MKHAPLQFENPFRRNGCTPCAFAQAGGLDAEGARLLAMYAQEKGLFSPRSNSGRSRGKQDFAVWASLARLVVLRQMDFREPDFRDNSDGGTWSTVLPTLQRFLSEEGAHGRWLVYTARHVQFVEDGCVYGFHRPRSRVQLAVEVRRA